MKTLLWLDDCRSPYEDNGKWLVFSPIPLDELTEVIWVKSYNEFVTYIQDFGVPDGCCFDHDLGDESLTGEKTGKDCADFLVEYCLDYGVKLPLWNCQSANMVGKENINSIMNNFKKYQENK